MKKQFYCISPLCIDWSLGPSIPPALLKTPLQELCTTTANSILETNLLCLLINIYSDIYQENMKGKSSICISSITCWGVSLNPLGHRHQRTALRSPPNLLAQISFFPSILKSKVKFWFTPEATAFLSAECCSPAQLLCKVLCCYDSEKAK